MDQQQPNIIFMTNKPTNKTAGGLVHLSMSVSWFAAHLVLLLLKGHSVNASHFLYKVVLVQGGVDPASLNGLDHCHCLNTSSSTQAMPNERLGGIHLHVGSVSEHLLDGLDLCNVTDKRAAATTTRATQTQHQTVRTRTM